MSKWEKVRLGDIVDVKGGKRIPKGLGYCNPHIEKGYPYLRVVDFKSNTVDTKNLQYIDENVASKIKRYAIQSNDVYISIAGTIGLVGTVPDAVSGAYLTENAAKLVIHNNQLVSNKYIVSVLASPLGQKQIHKKTMSTSQPKLALFRIEEIEIPMPPPEVQKKIADVLGKATSLIEKRKAQIGKLDLLIKSKFIEMFGDPVTNPKGWGIEKLCAIGDISRGVSKHRPRNDPKLLGGIYPLIQTGDVANAGLYIVDYSSTYSELGLTQSKMWKKDTLCITIAANIAKTGILAFDACFPDSVVGFLPNEKTNIFFINYWFAFFQKILEEQAPESAQKNINLRILYDLDIICPPIELQGQFSAFVQQIEAQKSLLRNSLEKLELNYKSLMQKCFRGEMF